MSKEKDPESSDLNDGATRVDLGEDLLEKTAVLTIASGVPSLPRVSDVAAASATAPAEVSQEREAVAPLGPLTSEQIEDQLQSARILLGEGIVEEAKRILRRILVTENHNVAARQMLEQIHEMELKQIFGESEVPRKRRRKGESDGPLDIRSEVVMQLLDRDLKLGIFAEDGTDSLSLQLSLFENRKAMEKFGARMDREYAGASVHDRIDIGIAFLEMGLHDFAIRHFEAAVQTLTYDQQPSVPFLLAATSLWAYALILGGRAFDATIALQSLLRDSEIDRDRKLDLIYLMGRAYDAMKKPALAIQWYEQAAEVDPGYRDLPERLRNNANGKRIGK